MKKVINRIYDYFVIFGIFNRVTNYKEGSE